MKSQALVLFLLACLLQTGSSLRCYVCDACALDGYVPEDWHIHEQSGFKDCYKCGKTYSGGVAARTCVPQLSDPWPIYDGCTTDADDNGVCYCSGDLCNAGERMQGSAVTASVLATIGVVTWWVL